jgi:hypothetical protein
VGCTWEWEPDLRGEGMRKTVRGGGNGNGRTRNDSLPFTALISSRDYIIRVLEIITINFNAAEITNGENRVTWPILATLLLLVLSCGSSNPLDRLSRWQGRRPSHTINQNKEVPAKIMPQARLSILILS